MDSKQAKIKIGQAGIKIGDKFFSTTIGNTPATWEFDGVVNGAARMCHVKPASQTTALRDQFISAEQLIRLAEIEATRK